MKKVKQLTLMSVLGFGLAVCAMQTATAADTYTKVTAATDKAAKFATSKDWRGARATCYIAERAREVARKDGLKDNTPEFQSLIARTTYKSATDYKVKELLTNEVTLRCGRGAVIAGLPRGAAIIGGSALAIGAIAALSNSNDDDDTVAGSRAPVSAE